MEKSFSINKFNNILSELDIKKGDIVLVNANILDFIIKGKKNIVPEDFIDCLKKRVTNKGTLIFPTYSWDFCEKKSFNYKLTKTISGALSNITLQRKDFKRTRHPIYSLAVYGKFKNYLFNLRNTSSWCENSPFDFIYKKKAKNLFIGIDYKDAFTMDHYFEQKANVNYRYHKKFSAKYLDHKCKVSKKTYSMFVRNKKLCDTTILDPKLDKILYKKKGLKKIKNQKINYSLIDINIAGKILLNDLSKPKS